MAHLRRLLDGDEVVSSFEDKPPCGVLVLLGFIRFGEESAGDSTHFYRA